MHPIGEYSRRRFSRRHEYPTGHPLPAEIPPSERDATHIRAFRRRVSNGGAATENMKECGRSSLFEGSSCGWGSDFGRRDASRRRISSATLPSSAHILGGASAPRRNLSFGEGHDPSARPPSVRFEWRSRHGEIRRDKRTRYDPSASTRHSLAVRERTGAFPPKSRPSSLDEARRDHAREAGASQRKTFRRKTFRFDGACRR